MSNEIEKQKNRHLKDIGGRISEGEVWGSLSQYLLFLRHKKAYLYVYPFCKGKYTLDYGCGNGYGSFLLAELSRQVTAVDINAEIVRTCQQKYQHPNLSFQLVEPGKRTNFKDNSFDVVISFQVIEHVYDVQGYINELKRILKEDGVLIITTPNRKHRLYPFQRPTNPYHLREYSLKRLRKELNRHFENVSILGVAGNEEINKVEYTRVKKSVLNYFLPPFFKVWLKRFLFKVTGKTKVASIKEECLNPINKRVLDHYSVDDFSILERDVEESLDFLAILRNKPISS